MDDGADGQPEELVDLAHPLGVALDEVVVDGDEVRALAGQRVEIHRERRDQRLAFTGLHLGDGALVEHHAADQLHVEVAHAEGAARRLADHREGGDEDIVESPALLDLGLELGRLGLELCVAQRLHLRLERVDGVDLGLIALYAPIIGGTEDPPRDRSNNHCSVLLS